MKRDQAVFEEEIESDKKYQMELELQLSLKDNQLELKQLEIKELNDKLLP